MPLIGDDKHDLRRQEEQSEEAAHTFNRSDAHVFDIQALFLSKAVAMFDARAQAPIFVDLLDVLDDSKGRLVIKTNCRGSSGRQPPAPTVAEFSQGDGF